MPTTNKGTSRENEASAELWENLARRDQRSPAGVVDRRSRGVTASASSIRDRRRTSGLDLAVGRAEWPPGPFLGRRPRNCSRPSRPRRHRPDQRDSRPPRRTAGWRRTWSEAVRDLSLGFHSDAGSTKFEAVRWGHRLAEPDRECPDREAPASSAGSAVRPAADLRAWHQPRPSWSRECRTAMPLLPVQACCPAPRGSFVPVPRPRRYPACPSRRASAPPVEASGSPACRPGLPDPAFPHLPRPRTAWVPRSDSSSALLRYWDLGGCARPSRQGTFSTGSENIRSTDFGRACRWVP